MFIYFIHKRSILIIWRTAFLLHQSIYFLRPPLHLDPGASLGQPLDALDALGVNHDLLRRLVAGHHPEVAQDLDGDRLQLNQRNCSGV